MPKTKDQKNPPVKPKKKSNKEAELPVLDPLRAGIDIGSTFHSVCVPDGKGASEVHTFKTTTQELRKLVELLKGRGVSSVAMESTSVYWIPVYELLEEAGLRPELVNARQLHKVPGRKTDVRDCQWIQKLHSCGLLRGSFRPEAEIVAVRALTRQCANLVAEQTRTVHWMQKALDQMNVQVHRAVTDITGATGLSIIRAIVTGEHNPGELAKLRDPRCRKQAAEIAEHLEGTWKPEHLFNLQRALEHYDFLQGQIDQYEAQVQRQLSALASPDRMGATPPRHPKSDKAKKQDPELHQTLWQVSGVDLTTIDGVSTTLARTILTEVGPRLEAFPTEKDFVSWLRLCPKTAISGGKTLPKKASNSYGANRIGNTLRMAAMALSKSKSALGAQYRRKARAKSGQIAVFATARKLAVLIYRLLRYGQAYVDLGADVDEARFQEKRLQSLQNQVNAFGYKLVPIATG
jgi:transposase